MSGHTSNGSTENPISVYNAMLNDSRFPMEKQPPPATPAIFQGLISDDLLHLFNVVNYVVLSVLIALCGIAANVINILVFLRQGFKDTINISFFGLAISDLLTQIVTLLLSVCMNPWFQSLMFVAFMSGWVQVMTTRITAWITAFLTIERCLCIVMPLKVKAIVSAPRTKAVIVTIFLAATICVVPFYFTFYVDSVYEPTRNRSIVVLVFLQHRGNVLNAMIYLNNVVSPLSSFAVVVVCTLLLVVSINQNARWRKKFSDVTKQDNNDKTTTKDSRDQRVIKMVTACAAIYIVCFTPPVVIFVWMDVNPEFSLTGRYRNLFLLLNTFSLISQSVNSAVNIFVYYNMSTKYRETFRLLFRKKAK